MAKINFLKVEAAFTKTLHLMFVKNLVDGKPTISKDAVSYFRLDDSPRPKQPADLVEEGLIVLTREAEEEKIEMAKDVRRQQLIASGIPYEQADEVIEEEFGTESEEEETVISSSVTPPLHVTTAEDVTPPVPPIFLLTQHIHWFKKKKVHDVYEKLGITKEELQELQEKKLLTETEKSTILALLEKARKLKQSTIESLGLQKDETLIERERRRHVTKQFNVNETWLPL